MRTNKKLDQDDDSKKSHPALAGARTEQALTDPTLAGFTFDLNPAAEPADDFELAALGGGPDNFSGASRL